MNNTITKHLHAIIVLSLSLFILTNDLYGRETEGFLARSLAWGSQLLDQFKTTRTKLRTEIPKQRLVYKAAQVNGAIGATLTRDERAMLIKNLQSFKALVENTQIHPEDIKIVKTIVMPEQPGKLQKQYQGVTLYTAQFAQEVDKPFLESAQGKQSLCAVLMHAPPPQQLVSHAQRVNHEENMARKIFPKLKQWERFLIATRKKFNEQEKNPKMVAALQALENDTIIATHQEKIQELQVLLEKKTQDAELHKVLPLIKAKEKEVQKKLLVMAKNPNLTKTQKEALAENILAEYRQFISGYPASKEYVELAAQLITLTEEMQARIQQITQEHPEIMLYMQLLQDDERAVNGYTNAVAQMQNVGNAVQQAADKYNTTIWCKQLVAWIDACINALETNAQPEDHILAQEHEMRTQLADWHAVIRGHEDLEAYGYYRELNTRNNIAHEAYLKSEYARLNKTTNDIRKELEKKKADLLNMPTDIKEALATLEITDIDPSDFSAIHKSRLTKEYRKLSLKYHPDKNTDLNAKEQQRKINEAYDKLQQLLEPDFNKLTKEQRDQYAELQEYLRSEEKLATFLEKEYEQAETNIQALHRNHEEYHEVLEEYERRLERHVQNNRAFNRLFPRELMLVKESSYKAAINSKD
ncbi:MAG: DnaJ domain-containing protein [Candidatus Babeliales bacterium]